MTQSQPPAIRGIHHVTAIAGDAQRNVAFYTRQLGVRLVKRTVNFDDPGTYHLYYGDGTGTPGSILTFFPWANAVQGRAGAGMTSATAFSIPPHATDYWMSRFADAAYDFHAPVTRFDEEVLAFEDPDGLPLELIAHREAAARDGWSDGPVPSEQAIRSFHSVTLALTQPAHTARLLKEVFGYEEVGEENGRLRFRAPEGEAAALMDLVTREERGRPGRGTIHHVAFRARDDEEQLAWKEAIAALGFNVTPVMDRQYFRSIYFREPGGVLFEIATDPPGFTKDEDVDRLGTALKLPPWLEPRRDDIEKRLPELSVPA